MWFFPSYHLAGAFPLPLEVGYIFLLTVVHQQVVILEFLQKMSACPSTPPSPSAEKSDPDLPVNVQESLVEARVSGSMVQGQGHWVQQWTHGTFWRTSPLSSFSSVQSLSHVRLFVTAWVAARQASLSITNSWSLLKLISIQSVMPYSHLILCRPLLHLPPIPPSTRVFSNESTLHMRWPKYWSFSFSISPSNEYPGLTSFRVDWLDLLAVQGTLKSLLQHHSSKASIFQHSAFFTVQLSHPYMTTGKTIALTDGPLLAK